MADGSFKKCNLLKAYLWTRSMGPMSFLMDYELCLISRLEDLRWQYYNAAGSVWVEKGIIAQGLNQIDPSQTCTERRKQKWNKGVIFSQLLFMPYRKQHSFWQAVAGMHFSQTLCSTGLKAAGGFYSLHHSGCHTLSTGQQLDVCKGETKGETLTLLFSPAAA